MAEETVASTESAYATETITEPIQTDEKVSEVSKPETDWSMIPEDQLNAIIEKKTGIKLDSLAGMQKVLEEVKEDRKVARAENHALKEYKDTTEIDMATDKTELERIYNKRLDELSAKQDGVIKDAKTAQRDAETSMRNYILQTEGAKKLNGLVESNLVDYIVEDIKKDFGVGDDSKLYRFENIDGKQVLGKASFDDVFEEWFGQHRLHEFVLEGGIKGSGSRTGNSLKDNGPTAETNIKDLFGLGMSTPKSVY